MQPLLVTLVVALFHPYGITQMPEMLEEPVKPTRPSKSEQCKAASQRWISYLWLVGNGRLVEIVVIIVPHSSIPY